MEHTRTVETPIDTNGDRVNWSLFFGKAKVSLGVSIAKSPPCSQPELTRPFFVSTHPSVFPLEISMKYIQKTDSSCSSFADQVLA